MIKNSNQDEFELDDKFREELKAAGHLFPESGEEIIRAFDKITSAEPLPEHLKDPFKIIHSTTHSDEIHFIQFNKTIEENLAAAAREGSEISDDVKKEMEKDRKKAEEENKGRRAQSGS